MKAPKKGRAKPARPARTLKIPHGGPFGPSFFNEILPAMVHSCPCSENAEPVVTVHLGDGSVLDVGQVVKTEERYVILAVFEGVGADGIARTSDDVGLEAIPYDLVLRAGVRPAARDRRRLGFGQFIPATAPIADKED